MAGEGEGKIHLHLERSAPRHERDVSMSHSSKECIRHFLKYDGDEVENLHLHLFGT